MIPIIGPIIGDNEGQDKLVGRLQTWGKCEKLYRFCDVQFDHTDNPSIQYDYTQQDTVVNIHKLQDVRDRCNDLKKISHHYIPNNVFYDLDLGGDPRGIHGLCPAEILHTLRLGIFKYTIKTIQDKLTPTIQRQVNLLCKRVISVCSHQSDRDVPRTNFHFGLGSITKMSGGEYSGVILILLIILLCDDGKQLFIDSKIETSTINKYISLLENLLKFEQWMEKESNFKFSPNDISNMRTSVTSLSLQIKTSLNRTQGNGMKVLKFHILSHMVDDIDRFGSPQNYNGGPCESNFKPQKKMAKCTQQRPESIQEQLATRVSDYFLMKHAMNQYNVSTINNCDVYREEIHRPNHGTNFVIVQGTNNNNFFINSKDVEYQDAYSQQILRYLHQYTKSKNLQLSHVQCFTQYKCGEIMLHGDWNFRNTKWYDWAVFKGQKNSYIWGNIHFFFKLTNNINIMAVISKITENNIHDIPASTLFRCGKISTGMFTSHLYDVVNIDTLYLPAFVIPCFGSDDGTYLIMYPRSSWSEKFVNE